jgi:DNA repair protein RecN (Recombination protein N)
LENVEERLDLIQRLKKKYGGSVQSVLEYESQSRQKLTSIESAGEKITQLETLEASLLVELSGHASVLSTSRQFAADQMTSAVEKELTDLSMKGALFKVQMDRRASEDGVTIEGEKVHFDATGCDQVEFLIAPNPGEGLKPMVKIASGGETSRLMLALKNVLIQADTIPTLIFDEIDQGIGGKTGLVVGQKLRQLGRNHQVFCVTHLPQLAAHGDTHYHVGKSIEDGRTRTMVQLLNMDERQKELAGMLGTLSDSTLSSARELLQLVKEKTGLDPAD